MGAGGRGVLIEARRGPAAGLAALLSWWRGHRVAHLCSLALAACFARQECPAGDPEVFPYGVGTIRAVDGAELLEREAELRVLETLVTQAAGGDGRVALIEGPPGIGKTSLVSGSARLAAEAGMRCLSARGSPMERAFPFGVVRQMFEPALDAEERGEVFRPAAATP